MVIHSISYELFSSTHVWIIPDNYIPSLVQRESSRDNFSIAPSVARVRDILPVEVVILVVVVVVVVAAAVVVVVVAVGHFLDESPFVKRSV